MFSVLGEGGCPPLIDLVSYLCIHVPVWHGLAIVMRVELSHEGCCIFTCWEGTNLVDS